MRFLDNICDEWENINLDLTLTQNSTLKVSLKGHVSQLEQWFTFERKGISSPTCQHPMHALNCANEAAFINHTHICENVHRERGWVTREKKGNLETQWHLTF